MSPDDFLKLHRAVTDELKNTVKESIEQNVNGKIRNLDTKIDEYITKDILWKEQDKKWKESAQPSVSLGAKVITFTDAMKWILLTGASIAGFIMAIKTIDGLFK